MLRIAGVELDIFNLELFFCGGVKRGKQGGTREGVGWERRGKIGVGRWELAASC